MEYIREEWGMLVGLLIALLGVIYSARSFYLTKRSPDVETDHSQEVHQISEGDQSPNIKTKGDVTISFGDKRDD
ncbi:MAG: hypothetical protein HRU06_07290 [Oceanospirillaceae bacterium]|nr:hypothetical protein [Oceanospirillaceae bacterium]